MTWSERRIVTVLSTILAVLCAALLIVLGIRYRENRDTEQTDTPVLSTEEQEETAAFSELTYYNGSTTLSFSRDDSGAWVWSDDPAFPLDDSTITAITDWLSNWKPLETITDSEVLANTGLDEPDANLSATTPSGKISLLFGKKTDTGYYVRLNKDDRTAYLVDPSLYDLMCVPIYDMCVLPELPALAEDSIQAIVITGAATEDSAEGLSTVFTAQRADGDSATSWRSSGANVTDDRYVRALLTDLESLSFVKCVIYRPSEEAAAICGFENPAKISVTYTTETGSDAALDLVIGAPLPDGSGRYVRLSEDSTIYLLPTDAMDPLMHISAVGLDG